MDGAAYRCITNVFVLCDVSLALVEVVLHTLASVGTSAILFNLAQHGIQTPLREFHDLLDHHHRHQREQAEDFEVLALNLSHVQQVTASAIRRPLMISSR